MIVSVLQRKKLILTLVKQKQNCAWVCIVMAIVVVLFVNKKNISLQSQ